MWSVFTCVVAEPTVIRETPETADNLLALSLRVKEAQAGVLECPWNR
jgi:hypothetical protein